MQRCWVTKVRQPLVIPHHSCPEERGPALLRRLQKTIRCLKEGQFPTAPARIGGTLDTLAGAKWFTTLDLKSSYWQVDLHPDKISFLTAQGV
jgi:hypothetical protein